ncbi:MAG: site-specific integrase [Dermatophilus congolensis]|nr:site-specific integrase [Dermatophilus congolensis]
MRYTGPDGLRRSMEETFRTKSDAEAAWSLLSADLALGRWVAPEAARISVGEYALRWIKQRSHLADRTRELYRSLLRLHVSPYLGRVLIRDLNPMMVRKWRQDLVTNGAGVSTQAKAYSLLRAVMSTAVDDDLIQKNPCRVKGGGVERTPERPILDLAQVGKLADAIEPRLRLLVLLAVFGSLRWGELMALTREDIDLDEMTVHVRRSVAEVGGKLVVKQPKTAAGVRTVSLPEALRPELAAHLEAYAESGDGGRVFVGVRGSTLRRSNFAPIWKAARTAAELPDGLHLHDLRHTGNHLAATSGASTRELMARMGHASMRAALIYQHATAERDKAIADALNALYKNGTAS